jgi:hypothetical protein
LYEDLDECDSLKEILKWEFFYPIVGFAGVYIEGSFRQLL